MAKILLVDDDLYIRDLYEEILKDAGYEVETAVDGIAGLAKINQGGYDLILLDVMMPKLDGIGVLATLQEKPPQTPSGPIVLLTNLSSDPVVKDALNRGAKSYIVKSDLTPEDFLARIKQFI